MATILVDNLNQMLVTKNETIMQHSSNVHLIKIFVPNTYQSFDMTEFDCTLELAPPSQEYEIIPLEPEDESSKEGYIQYNFDLPAKYTKFDGNIVMQLTFTYVDESTMTSYVRKTLSCSLAVVPIERWSELITDNALSALDQKLVQIKAGITALNSIAEEFSETKADNIAINEDGDLQLKANGEFIGDAVPVVTPSTIDDFDSVENGVVNLNNVYTTVSI